jgi:hypothetical protein
VNRWVIIAVVVVLVLIVLWMLGLFGGTDAPAPGQPVVPPPATTDPVTPAPGAPATPPVQ